MENTSQILRKNGGKNNDQWCVYDTSSYGYGRGTSVERSSHAECERQKQRHQYSVDINDFDRYTNKEDRMKYDTSLYVDGYFKQITPANGQPFAVFVITKFWPLSRPTFIGYDENSGLLTYKMEVIKNHLEYVSSRKHSYHRTVEFGGFAEVEFSCLITDFGFWFDFANISKEVLLGYKKAFESKSDRFVSAEIEKAEITENGFEVSFILKHLLGDNYDKTVTKTVSISEFLDKKWIGYYKYYYGYVLSKPLTEYGLDTDITYNFDNSDKLFKLSDLYDMYSKNILYNWVKATETVLVTVKEELPYATLYIDEKTVVFEMIFPNDMVLSMPYSLFVGESYFKPTIENFKTENFVNYMENIIQNLFNKKI